MGCSKSACSTGHYRQNSTTFGHHGQKCVSDHDGSDFFNGSDFFRPKLLRKLRLAKSKSHEAGLNNAGSDVGSLSSTFCRNVLAAQVKGKLWRKN
jgi:hypothetical protein